LLENPGNDNNWITLQCEGVSSNRSSIGTEITIATETDDGVRKIHRVVGTGGSYGSSSLQQEIGLGRHGKIRSIKVYWPCSGRTQEFKDVRPNYFYHIKEDLDEIRLIKKEKITLDQNSTKNRSHHHSHDH